MTTFAIIFMVCALAGVSLLAGWCYYRVLRAPADPQAPKSKDS